MSMISPNPQFFECGENPQDALFNVDRLNQGMNNNRDLASQLQGQTRPMRDAPMPSVFMSAVFGFIDDKDYEDSTSGDYTDCRYWVKIKGLFPKTTDPKFEIKDENFFSMGSPKKITAVNLMEVTANSHSMAVGTPVMAYPVAPRDGSGIFNWVLIPLDTGLFPVIITGSTEVIANKRWEYQWEEGKENEDGTVTALEGGRTSGTVGPGLNGFELGTYADTNLIPISNGVFIPNCRISKDCSDPPRTVVRFCVSNFIQEQCETT